MIATAGLCSTVPAAGDAATFKELLDGEYARAVAATRADGGSPESVQVRYNAVRDLENVLPERAPVACRRVLVGLRAFARAGIRATESYDRLDTKGWSTASAQGRAAETVVGSARGACGAAAVPASPAARTPLEPAPGAAFTGAVRARVPLGARTAEIVADGSVLSRLATATTLLEARIRRPSGPIRSLVVRFRDGAGTPVGSVISESVWLLPPASWIRVGSTTVDRALVARLTARATGFSGYSATWVTDLADGAQGGWNGAARFPAASTVKLGVMAAALVRFSGGEPRRKIQHDLETIASWSSNLAANRLLRLLGDGDPTRGRLRAEEALRRLGAPSSTYPGEYRAGTSRRAAPAQPPQVSQRVTTARDLARSLETIHRVATGEPAVMRRTLLTRDDGRLLVGLLLRSERVADNVGLLASALPVSIPLAQKNGWISSARHTAAILYGPTGPVVCVVLTYREGLSLPEAQAYGRRIALVALERSTT